MSLPALEVEVEVEAKRKTKETYVNKRKKLKLKRRAISEFDIVGNLPRELAQTIFFHLNPSDLRNALSTCRKWRNLASDDYFWKRKCKMDKYVEMSETSQSKLYKSFVNGSENYWERIYVYNAALHENWQNHNFKDTILDLKVSYPDMQYFDDEIIILSSCLDKEKIIVYNYHDEKITVLTLPHFEVEDCFASKTLNFLIFVNKKQKLLMVWCVITGVCKLKLVFPDYIKDMETGNNLIAIWLFDGSWQIVNILSGKVEYKIETEDGISCVSFHKGQVALGTWSGVIKIMNWSNKLTTTLIDDKEIIQIAIRDEYLRSYSNERVSVWCLKSKAKLNTISQKYRHAVLLNTRTLLLTCRLRDDEGMLAAWDIVDNVCKYVIVVTEGELYADCVITNSHYIFTYSKLLEDEEGKKVNVKVWCQETGKCVSNFTLRREIGGLLVTDTKLVLTFSDDDSNHFLHLHNFEKDINLEQLNTFYAGKKPLPNFSLG